MSKTVITWGRMNPPTIGHQKLVDKVKAEAKKRGAMPHVFLTHTSDAKKNPLDYNTKIRIARKAFGSSVTKSNSRTIIEAMKELQSMGHTEVVLVVGSDRISEFKTLLNKYNGKDFSFNKIEVVSAGDRDPDSDEVSGMSASKLRALAQSGDRDKFDSGLPAGLSKRDKQTLYNRIRKVMGITEEIDYDDEDFEFTDKELETFLQMTNLESLDEDETLDEEFDEFLELNERAPLTVQQRFAIGRRMRRLQPKIKRRREIMKRRMADPKRLERRSRKAAIKLLRKRFAGKQGANYASLSPSAKISVDRIIAKKMAMIGKISKRLMPKIRKAEMERLKSARSGPKKESLDNQFENFIVEQNAYPVEIIFEEDDEGANAKLTAMLRQAFRDPTERMLVIRALKGGSKTLSNPKLRPFILKLLNRLLDATQDDPSMFAKMRDKLRRMSQADEVGEAQDPDIKDREGTQPAKYHSGLKKSTKIARDRHFKKFADRDDSNPANYKPAPGDANAKTKTSQYTKKYQALYDEDVDIAFNNFMAEQYIEEKALEGLKKKAEKSGISYSTLKKVYDRGMAAWKSGHRPGTTPQQWAYARVNSYITKGKTYHTADSDLRGEEVEEAKTHSWKSEGHYLENGQEWKGDQHNYEGGIWTGKEHTKDSQKLYHYKELPSKLRDKIDSKIDQTEAMSPYEKIRRWDQRRQSVGMKSVLPSKPTTSHFVKMKKSGSMTTMNVPSHEVGRYEKMGYKRITEQGAEQAAKERIRREKEADKRKHDDILDRARMRDVNKKNRATESVDKKFENMLSEGFTAGISDTMFATEFEEHKVQGGFAYHPSVMEAGGAGEEGTKKVVKKYKQDTPGEICEAIEFMEKHDISFSENIYRPLSDKYFEFFREARDMLALGEIEVNEMNRQILETDIGEFDFYEGEDVPLDCPLVEEEKDVELNKPKRGGPKKFYVYVKDPSTGNVKKVTFGDTTGLKAKINDVGARKSFASRHQCDTRNDKTSASYWACRLPRYAASLGMQVDNPGAFW